MKKSLVVAIGALAIGAAAPARAGVTVTEVPTPIRGGMPLSIAVAADGAVWYSAGRDTVGFGVGQAHIGRLDPRTMRVRVFPLGEDARAPIHLAVAGNGRVWGMMHAGSSSGLVSVDPVTGRVARVPIPDESEGLDDLKASPSGRLFARIARPSDAAPDDLVEIDPVSGARRLIHRSPAEIHQGPYSPLAWHSTFSALAVHDGALWLGEETYQPGGTQTWAKRVDPDSGQAQRFYAGTYATGSNWIAAGPAGQGWLMHPTAAQAEVIGIDGAGNVQRGAVPTDLTHLTWAGGALWAIAGNAVARIGAPGEAVSLTSPLTPGRRLLDIVAAPDGAIWSREAQGDNLVRIVIDGGASTANARSIADHGLAAPVTCSAACSGSVTVTVPRRSSAARAARRSRGRVLGRAQVRLREPGRATARVRLSSRAKRLLRTRKSWRATVRTRVRAGGRTRTSRRAVVLRFYPKPRRVR